MKRHAHLVGSLGLEDAETCMSTVAEILGECCARIPDGETGARGYWIRWQDKTFRAHPDLELVEITQSLPGYKDAVKRPFYRLRESRDPQELDLGELGYAREAVASYAVFKRLSSAGKIAAGTRFQVSLPSPIALTCGFIVAQDRSRLEPAIERAMQAEVARIQQAIPAERLAIQWDVCHEVIGADGGPPLPYGEAIEGSLERLGRLCGLVGKAAQLGFHLCYGDPGHKHIVEPNSLAVCVAFANGICRASPRPVDYVHMPVPRNRADAAYFAPLKDLSLPARTRLVIGLVHYTDGAEGTRRRMAIAERFVRDFDVATECGFGRRDPATIPQLLRIHREVAER